jgi:hypothetical protein
MRRLVIVLLVAAVGVTGALLIRSFGGPAATKPTGGVDWSKYPGYQEKIDRAVSIRDCATLHSDFQNAARLNPATGVPADGALMGYLTRALSDAHCPPAPNQ